MCALVTGVQTYSLPSCLVHGAQPDAILLCHDPVRPHMRGLPHYAMPGLEETLEANLRVARLTNPGVRAVGIALNTSKLSSAEAHRMCGETSRSEEHTSELQSLMRISYAVFCLKKKKENNTKKTDKPL